MNHIEPELFTQIDFKDWCKYAILPYIDLATWALLNGAEFTNSIMSGAIFPKAGLIGFTADSRLVRETKPRSEVIFKSSNINAMRAQLQKMTKNRADFCIQK